MKDLNFIKTRDSALLKKISSKADILEDSSAEGYLIESSEAEARKIITSLRDKKFKGLIILRGKDDAFNRRAIETLKIDGLVLSSALDLNDTLKQRDSGLNHVVAKEAVLKEIYFIVDMGEMSSLNGKGKARAMSRVIQNIKICRKAKCSLKIASFARDENRIVGGLGRRSFGVSLGMDSEQSKASVVY